MSESWEREDWERALGKVAGHLESIEKKVISVLLERAQFRRNLAAYELGKSDYEGRDNESLFDIRLYDYERPDSEAGRYYSTPEEVPFNKNLPAPKRKVSEYTGDRFSGVVLEEGNRVDLTPEIREKYIEFLDHLCVHGDDNQHGSATEWDIPSFRALSERIHYGTMYVAECKFNMDPEGCSELIRKKDRKGLRKKLRRPKKELEILQRVREKVESMQKDENPDVRRIICPEIIVRFYKNTIMPLTLDGEVEYLMQKKA